MFFLYFALCEALKRLKHRCCWKGHETFKFVEINGTAPSILQEIESLTVQTAVLLCYISSFQCPKFSAWLLWHQFPVLCSPIQSAIDQNCVCNVVASSLWKYWVCQRVESWRSLIKWPSVSPLNLMVVVASPWERFQIKNIERIYLYTKNDVINLFHMRATAKVLGWMQELEDMCSGFYGSHFPHWPIVLDI